MRSRIAASATLLLAGLLACGGNDNGSTSPTGGGPAGAVTVGAGIQFVSRHNGSSNPAVDTVAAGDTVTWTWTGGLPHSVQSIGAPAFTSSTTKTGAGTYQLAFTTPGTYHYDCAVHGQAMTGTVVVTAGTVRR